MELSIIFLPLIASIISGFFGKFIGDRNSEIVTSALVSISALLSVLVLYHVIVNQYEELSNLEPEPPSILPICFPNCRLFIRYVGACAEDPALDLNADPDM